LALENQAYLTDKPTVSQESMESLISRIKTLKKADTTAIVIVSLHWGGEHTLKPVPRQRLEAHWLIDAGADLLVCHHTHTLQIVETYKGKPIYYSIGNFIFDQNKPLNTKACMVSVEVTAHSMMTNPIPITIRNCTPIITP
jgi:poly-gamma-glutamate synthesis protein (capsule biosynthesis protein)